MSRKKSLKTLTPQGGTTLLCRLAFAEVPVANARSTNAEYCMNVFAFAFGGVKINITAYFLSLPKDLPAENVFCFIV